MDYTIEIGVFKKSQDSETPTVIDEKGSAYICSTSNDDIIKFMNIQDGDEVRFVSVGDTYCSLVCPCCNKF